MTDCEVYLKVLERLDDIARKLGAKDLIDLLSFPFAELLEVVAVSPRFFRYVAAVSWLIHEMLSCREK